MKKLMTLALAAGMLLGAATGAVKRRPVAEGLLRR